MTSALLSVQGVCKILRGHFVLSKMLMESLLGCLEEYTAEPPWLFTPWRDFWIQSLCPQRIIKHLAISIWPLFQFGFWPFFCCCVSSPQTHLACLRNYSASTAILPKQPAFKSFGKRNFLWTSYRIGRSTDHRPKTHTQNGFDFLCCSIRSLPSLPSSSKNKGCHSVLPFGDRTVVQAGRV